MDIYGSFSNPQHCLSSTNDNLIPLTTDSHHYLPSPPESNHHHHHNFFPDFPYVPSDEAAELEWLSQFIDDTTSSFHDFPPSIGSNITTTSSFLADTTNYADGSNSDYSKSSEGKSRSRRELANGGGVRRCSHCASEKTPQWRTGPMGPKTLCNACGVRFKSGRLVPEYRPAASPTFVLTQHSNSHRKVLELRRQKEMLRQQQQEVYTHSD